MKDAAGVWDRLRAVVTDATAWPQLLVALEPELLVLARRQPIGRLRVADDSPREIVTRVFARLHANDFAAVRQVCAIDPPPKLEAWLRVVVRRSAIDYMREAPEFERATATRPDRWISLASLTSSAPMIDPDSRDQKRALVLATVREMVTRADAEFRERGEAAFTHLALAWKVERIHVRRLVTKGAQMLAVLVATLEGRTRTDIAARLSLTRREVELSTSYLEEMLRARFA